MHDAEIAGVKPAAGERLLGRRPVLEITFHDHVAAHHHFAQRFAIARDGCHRLRVEHIQRLERAVAHALARLLHSLLGRSERVPRLRASR